MWASGVMDDINSAVVETISESVRLVTENGYADVMTLSYCDGAVLKGLVLGHEVKKGECDANVLKLLTSQSVNVENCSLFGCGTYGIYGEDAAVLTVTGTEIYECTNGILNLSETSHTVVVKEYCKKLSYDLQHRSMCLSLSLLH